MLRIFLSNLRLVMFQNLWYGIRTNNAHFASPRLDRKVLCIDEPVTD